MPELFAGAADAVDFALTWLALLVGVRAQPRSLLPHR
jgi:hypothetical protein